MSATCGNCTAFTVPFTGSLTVRLCPLHAEAEAMRDVLVRLVEEYDDAFGRKQIARALFEALGEGATAARPILARIAGGAA